MDNSFKMPKAEPNKALRVFWAFLLAILVFIILHFWNTTGAVIFATLTFVYGSIALLRTNTKKVAEGIKNEIAIVGVSRNVWKDSDAGRGWRNERVNPNPYPRIVDIEKYIAEKGENRFISCTGSSRSGKSILVYWLIQHMSGKKIIFQLKSTDQYVHLGYPTLYIKKYVPNVFASKVSFVRSFLTAFSISAQLHGITTATLENEIRNIVNQSETWKQFRTILVKGQEVAEKKHDGITRSALNFIEGSIRLIESDKVVDFELPQEVVYNFEGDEKNPMDLTYFTFYGEFLLNQINSEVWFQREGSLIVIDEAHLLIESGKSIIPTMTATIGAKGGMILASQRIADLEGKSLDNMKTQFTFKTTGKKNLDEIKAVSDLMETTVSQFLETYEMADVGQLRPDKQVWIFKLLNPEITTYPVKEIMPKTSESGKTKENNQNQESEGRVEIDIPQKIISLLSEPANQNQLAKRFVKDYGQTVDIWKMRLKGILRSMSNNDEIQSIRTDYVVFVDGQAYPIEDSPVFHLKGDFSYHEWLVKIVADILASMGMKPVIQAHGTSNPDIIVDDRKMAWEVEVGTKQGYKMTETVNRFEELRKQGYTLYIIVPNPEIKKRYGEYHTYTALEFWKLKEVIKNE